MEKKSIYFLAIEVYRSKIIALNNHICAQLKPSESNPNLRPNYGVCQVHWLPAGATATLF